jgi:hypothetical protein
MGRGRQKEREATGIVPAYEGPEVLTALLASAGSPYAAEEAAERFARAQRAGEGRSEVIPALFQDQPRFASPADARRLYANLFGLWERIAAGLGPVDDAPEVAPEPPPLPPLPPRGSLEGAQLTPDLVESMWRHIASLPQRELRRLRDHFEGVQPNLLAWLDQVPLPESGGLSASDLVFEAWAMFDQGFGERLDAVEWKDLTALEAEPPPLESAQPALAQYVAEQLDNLADEDPEFNLESRAQVERALASAVAALTRAVQEDA